jgi:hypothetical protein
VSFNNPSGITTDGTNLYVADTGNHSVRKMVLSTGVVSTLSGTVGANGFSYGITTDGVNLYVADYFNDIILEYVIATGVATTLAGTAGVQGSTDGTGIDASFYGPRAITTDGTNLYVADTYNDTIRQIVIATGVVTTLAGTAGVHGSSDGIGPNAHFYVPAGITTDGTNLYVADSGNNTLRQIVIATGVVTTLAGTAGVRGSANGIGPNAEFNYPSGITSDGTNLYVADSNNSAIRKIIISTGEVTTLAGDVGFYGSTDGTGSAARFYWPYGVTIEGADLYVVDSANSTIRKIVISTGVVTTIAGTAGVQGATDGTGSVSSLVLN